MKKILLLWCFLLPAIFAHSQEETQNHLEFKGIPLTGNYKSFAQKLVAQGCKIISTDENRVALEGSFVSKTCIIGVIPTATSKTVWKVAAILPEHSTWRTLKQEYGNLKAQYSTKYGEPDDVEESVSESYLEGNEWHALRLGKCTYRSDWYTEAGFISIQMTEEYSIIIHYEDAIGSELKSKEIQSDI